MGEVRATVRLTNAIDAGLARRQMLRAEDVRSVEADALVDTGAVSLVVPSLVAERLGLGRIYKHVAQYADGRQEEVDVTEGILVEVLGRRTLDEAVVLGDEVILGQTVLEKMDLRVDCREHRLIPNPAHPDQPVVKIK